jgi:hypothetical protein
MGVTRAWDNRCGTRTALFSLSDGGTRLGTAATRWQERRRFGRPPRRHTPEKRTAPGGAAQRSHMVDRLCLPLSSDRDAGLTLPMRPVCRSPCVGEGASLDGPSEGLLRALRPAFAAATSPQLTQLSATSAWSTVTMLLRDIYGTRLPGRTSAAFPWRHRRFRPVGARRGTKTGC